LLELEFREIPHDAIILGPHFGEGPGLIFRRFPGDQFLEHGEVCDPGLEREEGLDFAAEIGDLLDVALGGFFIVPEVRRGHAGLDFTEFLSEVG